MRSRNAGWEVPAASAWTGCWSQANGICGTHRIGAWTVQGALLIALHRPDVVRPDDLALRHAVQARYGLDHLPDPAEVADLAQGWRPYRSLASSLLAAPRPT